MKIEISSFENGNRVAYENCFCILTDKGIEMGKNINPEIKWSEFPPETKSFALVCVDPDVPSVGDDVNQEGKTVPFDLPRVDFYHWVLADIPANITKIDAGFDSNGITPHGKSCGSTYFGAITGYNDYTGWFSGDENMKGFYGGYDGPCPPWNDERIHHYYYRVYALDIEKVGLSDNFSGSELIAAIQNHILDSAEYMGTYTLNKNLL